MRDPESSVKELVRWFWVSPKGLALRKALPEEHHESLNQFLFGLAQAAAFDGKRLGQDQQKEACIRELKARAAAFGPESTEFANWLAKMWDL